MAAGRGPWAVIDVVTGYIVAWRPTEEAALLFARMLGRDNPNRPYVVRRLR